MNNMQMFVKKHLSVGTSSRARKVADIGSQVVTGQAESYKDFFNADSWQYLGVDMIEGNNVDIRLQNPYSWDEIKSDTFDVVISGQALEHVEYIWVTMLEIARILKSGGLCCIVVPSQGHKHSFPLDCWRFFDDGLVALAKWARLEVVEVYTQNANSDDEIKDPEWQDSVIVCRKPQHRFFSRIKFYLANRVCRLMVKNLVNGAVK